MVDVGSAKFRVRYAARMYAGMGGTTTTLSRLVMDACCSLLLTLELAFLLYDDFRHNKRRVCIMLCAKLGTQLPLDPVYRRLSFTMHVAVMHGEARHLIGEGLFGHSIMFFSPMHTR